MIARRESRDLNPWAFDKGADARRQRCWSYWWYINELPTQQMRP